MHGNYRVQMNEHAIGIPLPSWMFFIGESAIPTAFRTAALLHAKAYSPAEACAAGIFHGLIEEGADVDVFLSNEINALTGLHMKAYAVAKRWWREKEAKEALALLLQDELPSK